MAWFRLKLVFVICPIALAVCVYFATRVLADGGSVYDIIHFIIIGGSTFFMHCMYVYSLPRSSDRSNTGKS
jgi:hypothetical protein